MLIQYKKNVENRNIIINAIRDNSINYGMQELSNNNYLLIGILANICVDSMYSGVGNGILQWSDITELENFATDYGTDTSDVYTQTLYLMSEMKSSTTELFQNLLYCYNVNKDMIKQYGDEWMCEKIANKYNSLYLNQYDDNNYRELCAYNLWNIIDNGYKSSDKELISLEEYKKNLKFYKKY